jgi:DNA-binding MarR family transcriptional regulator
MSRAQLRELLAERGMSPEREQVVASVLDEGRRMSTRTVLFHAAIAERLGLNPSDHKCADLICNEAGPLTAGRLAELTGLSTGAITGVVDRLERAGFVSRVPDPQDRRRVVISGSNSGRAPDLRHLFLPLMAGMVSLCESYSDAELSLIVDFMRRSAQLTDARIQALREPIPHTPPLPSPVRAARDSIEEPGKFRKKSRNVARAPGLSKR